MTEIETERCYKTCHSTPNAWAYITASGDVYSCSAYISDERFLLGNINKNTFQEIWHGERRKAHIDFMKSFDINDYCRRVCRMNQTNKTLDAIHEGKIITPGEMPGRVNFI